MTLPLEDLFNDVIGKSQRGLGLSDIDLAALAGIGVNELAAVKNGDFDAGVTAAICGPLKLHAASLIAMAQRAWQPRNVSLNGLAQFNTPWEDMTVNAYLIWDPESKAAVAFDTGATAKPMVDFIKAHGLSLDLIFLTHTHHDHVADLTGLLQAGAPTVFVNEREPFPGAKTFSVDDTQGWTLGDLRIEPRNTFGHSKGGTTYVVSGLAFPVAVVGDAVFASSMGGGMVSYADALATNRKEIFSLPNDTILCPGHGPLTTVGEEKLHNPFFPEFK